MPSYNNADYIGQAIISVLEQDYENIELIIIDNNSKDDTDKVINSFNDPRIKYVKINNNGVIAASRNAGINLANGEWIAFLDSDDWWKKNKISKCFELASDSVEFIYHDVEKIIKTRGIFNPKKIKSWKLKTPILLDLLIRGNPIVNSSVVIKTSLLKLIGGIEENAKLISAEDYNTWLKVAAITENFLYINEILGCYRVHENGASNRNMEGPIFNACANFMDNLDIEAKQKVLARLAFIQAKYFFQIKQYSNSFKSSFHGLKKGACTIRIKSLLILVATFILIKIKKND